MDRGFGLGFGFGWFSTRQRTRWKGEMATMAATEERASEYCWEMLSAKGLSQVRCRTRLCVGAGLNADPCGGWQTMGYVSGGGESDWSS